MGPKGGERCKEGAMRPDKDEGMRRRRLTSQGLRWPDERNTRARQTAGIERGTSWVAWWCPKLVCQIESCRPSKAPSSVLQVTVPIFTRLFSVVVLVRLLLCPVPAIAACSLLALLVALAAVIAAGTVCFLRPRLRPLILSTESISSGLQALYLPLSAALMTGDYVSSLGPLLSYVAVVMVVLACAVYVPFHLLITQNCYPVDRSLSPWFARLHNRQDAVVLLSNTLLSSSLVLLPDLRLPSLLLPFLLHAATYPYYNAWTNGVVTAGYLLPLLVASAQLHLSALAWSLLLLSLVPCSLLHRTPLRGWLNTYLQHRVLSVLDLQSNPARLESWGMDASTLAPLHRAMYAQHLICSQPRRSTRDEEIERLFTSALAQDGGGGGMLEHRVVYARWLVQRGERERAIAQYRKVLEATPYDKATLEAVIELSMAQEQEEEKAKETAVASGSSKASEGRVLDEASVLDLLDRLLYTDPQHRQLDTLYSDSLDGACLITLSGHIRDCNAVAVRNLGGRRREDVVGTDMSDWLHDEKGRRRLAMALSTLAQQQACFSQLRSHPSVRFQAYVRCRRALTPAAALRGPAPRLCTLTATLRAVPSASRRLWAQGASKRYDSKVVHLCWVDQSHMVSQHEALFTRAGEAMVMLDKRGRVVEGNDRMEELFGYTQAELVRKELRVIFDPLRATAQWRELQGHTICAKGRVMSASPMCWYGRTKAGMEKKLEVQLREVEVQEDSVGGGGGMQLHEHDEDDDGRRFLLVMKDVTELHTLRADYEQLSASHGLLTEDHQALRRELAEEKAFAAFLFKHAPGPIIGIKDMKDDDDEGDSDSDEVAAWGAGRVVAMNPAGLQAFGGDVADGRSVKDLLTLPSKDRSVFVGKGRGGRSLRLEKLAEETLSSSVAARRHEPCRWMALRDATDSTRFKALFSSLFETARSCVLMLDRHGKVLAANPACCAAFGYRQLIPAGKRSAALEAYPDELEDEDQAFISRYSSPRAPSTVRKPQLVRAMTKSGRSFRMQLVMTECEVGVRGEPLHMAVLLDVEEFEEMAEISCVALEYALSPLVILDDSFAMIRMNACALSTFGYERELFSRPAKERRLSLLQSDRYRDYPEAPAALSGPTVMDMSCDPNDIREVAIHRRPDSKVLRCRVRVRSFTSEGKTHYALLFSDDTDVSNARAEKYMDFVEKLNTAQEELMLASHIWENTDSALLRVDSEGTVLMANHEMDRAVGAHKHGLLGQHLRSLILHREWDDDDGMEGHLKITTSDWVTRNFHHAFDSHEGVVLTSFKSGRGVVLNLTVRPLRLRQPDDTVRSEYLCIFRDAAEERDLKATCRAVLESHPCPVVLIRLADGIVIDANDAIEKATGCTRAALLGRRYGEVFLSGLSLEKEDHEAVSEWTVAAKTLQVKVLSVEGNNTCSGLWHAKALLAQGTEEETEKSVVVVTLVEPTNVTKKRDSQ